MTYVSVRKASKLLDYTPDHLRRLANAGKIDTIRTGGGHRRYDVEEYIKSKSKTIATVCYCRVFSPKQRDDLE